MKTIKLKQHKDQRGWLVELFVNELGKGQVYLFTINPAYVRGNHYHKRKYEYFVILEGKVKVGLKNMKTGKKETRIFDADKAISRIYVGSNTLHAFKNVGKKRATVVAFVNEKENPKNPDDYWPPDSQKLLLD